MMTPQEFDGLDDEGRQDFVREFLGYLRHVTGADVAMVAILKPQGLYVANGASESEDPQKLAFWKEAVSNFAKALAKCTGDNDPVTLADEWKDGLS